ncbi:hypothetical protein GCM10010276_43610 [Streptomyces longisporus]|uniref:Uncharacterized protein n=1 Tax=Streptomyces longisporus TaxID=1948 RepID=A0ABN3M950_STRLO
MLGPMKGWHLDTACALPSFKWAVTSHFPGASANASPGTATAREAPKTLVDTAAAILLCNCAPLFAIGGGLYVMQLRTDNQAHALAAYDQQNEIQGRFSW